MRFRARLEATGKNTAAFHVPTAVVDDLAGGRRPKVVVTVHGFTFRTSIASRGGHYLLGVSAERRAEADIAVNEAYEVDVHLDTAPREVEVPNDLAAALQTDPSAYARWRTLSYSKQQWHVLQVTGAKRPETRAARLARSVAMLRDGRAP